MSNKMEKNVVQQLLSTAGIEINGQSPTDIQILNDDFYTRVVKEGALGLGEAYMENWWTTGNLDAFFDRLLRAELDSKANIPLRFLVRQILSRVVNFQTKLGSKKVARQHYDLGNELFSKMLDPYMQYSCGYWKEAASLNDAQTAKLDLICRKLQLEPGMTLLDIGCGWGGLLKYAAENYQVNAVGITISEQQYQLGKKMCAGLPVDLRIQDYRDISEQFDRVVSVGMFEHVGHLNYDTYMRTARKVLKDDGLFLLHTIGINEYSPMPNEWINKYIFPNGALPTISQISKVCEKRFVIEDLHNFGAYYDNTLLAWYDNFHQHWDSLKKIYDDRFYRMWTYYLLSCAGGFRSRSLQLWQFILSKHGVTGGYLAPR